MNTFDLTLLSLYRIDGQEWPLLPGLLAQNPPKKTARGREQDRLVVYLTLAGNISYSNGDYAEIVGQVAETFYNTPGSLTFALKTAAEGLNSFLVEKNMKSTGKGLYSIGALILCNLRGDSLYVVQSGPTHVYHLGAETRHLADAQLAGKGLGLSQTARLYFAQTTLNPGERVLLCAALPPNWDKAITEGRGSPALEMTRRRLLAITDTNVNALLLQVTNGSGAINILQNTNKEASKTAPGAEQQEPAPETTPAPPAAVMTVAAPPVTPERSAPGPMPKVEATYLQPNPVQETVSVQAPESPPESDIEEAPSEDEIPVDESDDEIETDDELQEMEAEPATELRATSFTQTLEPQPSRKPTQDADDPEYAPEPKVLIRPETRARFMQGMRVAASTLARLIGAGRAQTQSFRNWGRQAVPRLMPGDGEDQHTTLFSRAWPVFFAIAIPILLLVTARVVYYQRGYNAQYQTYYNQADEASRQAQEASSGDDSTNARVLWKTALDRLDKADQFQEKPTIASQQLRTAAQKALDDLDQVVRLNFQPAFDGSLGKGLLVTRMSASDTDIYMLDAVLGSVKRGTYNPNNKYNLDTTFICGPGFYDGIQVGKLIDIIALPRSNPTKATLLGIDNSGNLLYCIPDETPIASYLQVPDRSWNTITAIAYDTGNLYLLDAPARAVWVYFGDSEIKFPDKPYYFFESQVPVMLEQAIDMAVNGDDLYLLHKDGHLTTCFFSHINVSPTRCNDPALYIDTRPGYQGGMSLSDGIFSQIVFTNPPDPSVALLESYNQSVFRFSASALELQNLVRAGAGKENTLPKGAPVTAMAFSPNKLLFIFVDGQVFFANNVPLKRVQFDNVKPNRYAKFYRWQGCLCQ